MQAWAELGKGCHHTVVGVERRTLDTHHWIYSHTLGIYLQTIT